MSRVADNPVNIPDGVTVVLDHPEVLVKGPKGDLSLKVNDLVTVTVDGETVLFSQKGRGRNADAMAGTTRALVQNMVTGVSEGFEKRLELQGVGYRAQVQGKKLNLSLGFSHPVVYEIPEGVQIETPSQTEIIVKGIDKQQVGQVAANIRAYREPEPYKGKGVRYSDEVIVKKEAKKA